MLFDEWLDRYLWFLLAIIYHPNKVKYLIGWLFMTVDRWESWSLTFLVLMKKLYFLMMWWLYFKIICKSIGYENMRMEMLLNSFGLCFWIWFYCVFTCNIRYALIRANYKIFRNVTSFNFGSFLFLLELKYNRWIFVDLFVQKCDVSEIKVEMYVKD